MSGKGHDKIVRQQVILPALEAAGCSASTNVEFGHAMDLAARARAGKSSSTSTGTSERSH
jgi:hypothetical protein